MKNKRMNRGEYTKVSYSPHLYAYQWWNELQGQGCITHPRTSRHGNSCSLRRRYCAYC